MTRVNVLEVANKVGILDILGLARSTTIGYRSV
jgi:hypothetical protein